MARDDLLMPTGVGDRLCSGGQDFGSSFATAMVFFLRVEPPLSC
ncbi:hypothetical protein B005_5534 [Nocardiopsis alba ATCC BAA-2165]|uniref:Uncharacterized protein n=1 Tax=Nocardiopsis alba (strain ATCC BAA-2165 / BE74) TaxID=1205910 RepID=J7L2R0_NOCAA|nr:hypothetical protein B005_5534 [Nocardiopsis alba ATCC BAA-2165]